MRVAVVGDGPGGPACAMAFERRDISPDIYERSIRMGLRVPMVRDQLLFPALNALNQIVTGKVSCIKKN